MNVSWVLAPNGTKNWKTRKTLGNEVLWEQINISWWGRGVSGGRCPWAALVLLSPKPMMITCLKGAEPKVSGTGRYFPQDPPRKPTYAATHWTMTSGYSESPFNSIDMLPGIRGVSLTGPIWSTCGRQASTAQHQDPWGRQRGPCPGKFPHADQPQCRSLLLPGGSGAPCLIFITRDCIKMGLVSQTQLKENKKRKKPT